MFIARSQRLPALARPLLHGNTRVPASKTASYFSPQPVKVNNGYGAAISDPEDPMGLGIFGCKFWGLKRKEGSNSCENKK